MEGGYAATQGLSTKQQGRPAPAYLFCTRRIERDTDRCGIPRPSAAGYAETTVNLPLNREAGSLLLPGSSFNHDTTARECRFMEEVPHG